MGERHEELLEIVAAELGVAHLDAFGFQRLQHESGPGAFAQVNAPLHAALLHRAEARELLRVEPVGGQREQHGALGQQLLERAFAQHAAMVEDGHAIGNGLDLFHVVRGIDHRRALLRQALDGVEDEGARLRIDAHRGLVEQHQLGLGQQRDGQVEAALEAAREPLGAHAGKLFELRKVRAGLDALFLARAGQAARRSKACEVLGHGEHRIEGLVLRRHRDARGCLGAHLLQRLAVDEDLAPLHGERARQMRDQRGLARAVGAEQAHDTAPGHRKRDVGQRGRVGVRIAVA